MNSLFSFFLLLLLRSSNRRSFAPKSKESWLFSSAQILYFYWSIRMRCLLVKDKFCLLLYIERIMISPAVLKRMPFARIRTFRFFSNRSAFYSTSFRCARISFVIRDFSPPGRNRHFEKKRENRVNESTIKHFNSEDSRKQNPPNFDSVHGWKRNNIISLPRSRLRLSVLVIFISADWSSFTEQFIQFNVSIKKNTIDCCDQRGFESFSLSVLSRMTSEWKKKQV